MGTQHSSSTHTAPPPKLPRKKDAFKVNVAIDFGTYGCGIAFAFNNKIDYHVWKANKTKTKTQILLDENDNVVTFGDEAKSTFESLQSEHKLTWKFFERFKMALYETEYNDMDGNDEKYASFMSIRDAMTIRSTGTVNIIDTLISADGRHVCSAEIVFVAAFKYLADKAMKCLRCKTKENIYNEDIEWIITVPSIWNDKAKDKMTKWLIKSGLIIYDNQFKIVYEADCASLAIHHQIYEHKKQNEYDDDYKIKTGTFGRGEKYILIDAGGGTVDIICHQIWSDFEVREIMYPTGGKWGSCYVDDEYIYLLEKIFTKKWIDEFRKEQPNEYMKIIENFQAAKCTFYENCEGTEHICELTEEFVQFIEEKCISHDCNIQDKIERHSGIVLVNELLVIDAFIWKQLFDSVLNKIICKIEEIWNENKDIFENECKYLCLVGGFSCSKYLQYRMKTTFGINSKYKLELIIPDCPTLTVVEGAAYFGLNIDFKKTRRLRSTYGFHANIPLSTAIEWGIPRDHIQQNNFLRVPKLNEINQKKQICVRNCFVVLARKNEEILTNTIKTKKFTKTSPDQKCSYHYILSSDLENPKVVNDGKILGKVRIDWNKKNNINHNNNDDGMMQFKFYDTTVKVSWYWLNNPHLIETSSIIYDRQMQFSV